MKLASLFLVFGLLQGNCSFLTSCEDDIKDQVVSPSGDYVATWLVRNCGATTDYSSLVKVHPSRTSSADEEVVFIAKGDPEIRLTWQEDSVLKIACDACTNDRIFQQVRSWRGVSINY
jgi:hypothetical protein